MTNFLPRGHQGVKHCFTKQIGELLQGGGLQNVYKYGDMNYAN